MFTYLLPLLVGVWCRRSAHTLKLSEILTPAEAAAEPHRAAAAATDLTCVDKVTRTSPTRLQQVSQTGPRPHRLESTRLGVVMSCHLWHPLSLYDIKSSPPTTPLLVTRGTRYQTSSFPSLLENLVDILY